MQKILTIAGISLLSGTALARAPEPTIEINIDVLQQMSPPPAAPQAAPVYKPSVEKNNLLSNTEPKKVETKKTKQKKKKVKKPKVEKTLPRPEFIKPAPAVIVPVVPEPAPALVPIEVAPPAPAPILEEVKPVEEVAPTPAPVVEQPAAKIPLQDRVLYKLQDWALAADNWRLGLKDRLMRKTPEQQTPVAPAPLETPVETAPPVDAPKPVEMMKIEKPQEPVHAPQKVEEIKPEPFVIPAEEAPFETPPAAPIANDLAPPPPAVVEAPKEESIFQKAVKKITNWRNELRDRLADKKPEEKAMLPETPPLAAEPEKPTLPDAPPAAVAADKPADAMKELPSAPPPVSAKIPLPDAPPAVVVPEKVKEKLPDAPPAKALAAAPQNILPDVPPVPATVTKNTGALYVIPFAADSDEIKLEEQGYLLALVQRMKQEENLRIAVQGFAPLNNGQEYEARRLSLKRAVGVRQFLMDKGVDATRVNVQALGSATEESLKDRVDILRIN